MHTLALTLFLGLGLHLVQASFYQLQAFDTVHVGVLGSNQATVVIVPSPDETFSLNASQSGVAFSVNDGTLYLSQAVTVKSLLDGLLHDQDDDGVQTGAIYVEVGGPLAGVVSDTTNDVVVGDKFSSAGFTASLTTIGKLIVLGITTPFTSAWNTGGGTLYIQGDLGTVKVTASEDGGTYLGSSVHYPGDINSVDVQLSGQGSLIVATSSNETRIRGQSFDSGQVLYNQGSCDVAGPTPADDNRCVAARIRVPALPQYWALSDGAQTAAVAQLPPPPPPSPPPPMPVRDAKVTPEEATNLISPLAVAPAPGPSDPGSAAGPTAAPDASPAAAPARDIFPAYQIPDIPSTVAAPAAASASEAASPGAYLGALARGESPAAAPDLAPVPNLAPAPVFAVGANIGSAGAAYISSVGAAPAEGPAVRATANSAGGDSVAGSGPGAVSQLSVKDAGK